VAPDSSPATSTPPEVLVIIDEAIVEPDISKDEEAPEAGETQAQREERARKNHHRSIRRHHLKGEKNLDQPMSHDEASWPGEQPEEWELRLQRNQCWNARRAAQCTWPRAIDPRNLEPAFAIIAPQMAS